MGAARSKVVTVHVTGPLAPLAAGFESMLSERGYTPLTRVRHLQVMLHLSRWLQARQWDAAGLTDHRVEQYLAERRAGGYTAYCSRTSLSPLWELLALHGASLGASPTVPASRADVLLAGYSRFLREERALASSTTAAYVVRARRFLAEDVGEHSMGGLGSADVIGAVLCESTARSVGSTQFFVVALRAFLRYCYLVGLVQTDLSAAALPVTGRRRSFLPRRISPVDARALLRSCDRRTGVGRRDYAVILILLRLGLRAGEVAALSLADLDWRVGQIVVHGKAGRVDRLPLPVDVGEAIAGYLRHARPDTAGREVFVRTTAPRAGLSRGGVSLIVRRACVRAGLAPAGAHRLRHSLVISPAPVG